ncbi:hypothetical protein [Helicobacter cetorum]|uniref:Uncharacterized protein n=2 Tax=Helicobacter cetorum TaxID=138563 RepID=I0EPN7_HELC0|nr:hypothetical protein [Helicobacter cetorum]ABS86840.1 hypothetical protein pz43w [Helicobacter cetorum]AFI04906.1 hypothetical protein HCW_08245 [Helicobacter cetorum MIT 00-7128]
MIKRKILKNIFKNSSLSRFFTLDIFLINMVNLVKLSIVTFLIVWGYGFFTDNPNVTKVFAFSFYKSLDIALPLFAIWGLIALIKDRKY